jgi:hypothetical protein
MLKKLNRKTAAVADLPPDVRASDLEFAKEGDGLSWDERKTLPEGAQYELTFYQVKNRGWVLTTLLIGKAGRRRAGREDRTYGIEVATEQIVRVGFGPHVTKTVSVRFKKSNIERLRKYIDLWLKGMESAGNIRDRISTRRAQGQLYRAQGRTSWMW